MDKFDQIKVVQQLRVRAIQDNIQKAEVTDEDVFKASSENKKVKKVMDEFAAGKLKSSSGEKVTDRKQAIAIAMSESGLSKADMDIELNSINTGIQSTNT